MITILKRAAIFALILGAFIGLLSLIPTLIGICLFALCFFTSLVVIMFMKKNEKHLGIIDTQQGAILGGVIGFFSGIGFFITFSPMVVILHWILKDAYSGYAFPYLMNIAFWLYLVIVVMVSAIFAMTNVVTGMGIAWILDKIEEKPENFDAPLDIKIED